MHLVSAVPLQCYRAYLPYKGHCPIQSIMLISNHVFAICTYGYFPSIHSFVYTTESEIENGCFHDSVDKQIIVSITINCVID